MCKNSMSELECCNAYLMSKLSIGRTYCILYQVQAHCRGCPMLCHKDDIIAPPTASSLCSRLQMVSTPAA